MSDKIIVNVTEQKQIAKIIDKNQIAKIPDIRTIVKVSDNNVTAKVTEKKLIGVIRTGGVNAAAGSELDNTLLTDDLEIIYDDSLLFIRSD